MRFLSSERDLSLSLGPEVSRYLVRGSKSVPSPRIAPGSYNAGTAAQ